ncbi:MAG TPA: DUF3489 domain-containing protein [Propionibacteriaceae bacterium]|jgi:hypothetical protein
MARALRPTRLQLTLLAAAADRTDGNVFPLEEQIAGQIEEVEVAITQLLQGALITEHPGTVLVRRWREHMKDRIGLKITQAGRALVDRLGGHKQAAEETAGVPAGTVPPCAPLRTSKLSIVLTLMERGEGATSAELIGATDWQAHTVRAALSGLRQKGHAIESSKRDRLTCYHAASVIRPAETRVRTSAGVQV